MHHNPERSPRRRGSRRLAPARSDSRLEPSGNSRETDRGRHLKTLGTALLVLLTAAGLASAQERRQWRATLAERLPLYGHRNWIVIADSAYPLQSGPGIETIQSNDSQIETVRHVLQALSRQTHVRPVVYTDQELRFVPEEDAPGIGAYRQLLDALFDKNVNNLAAATTLAHEAVIKKLDEAGREFHVLIIKTNMTLPYTSVFIELRAAYWSDDAEKRLRQNMPSQ